MTKKKIEKEEEPGEEAPRGDDEEKEEIKAHEGIGNPGNQVLPTLVGGDEYQINTAKQPTIEELLEEILKKMEGHERAILELDRRTGGTGGPSSPPPPVGQGGQPNIMSLIAGAIQNPAIMGTLLGGGDDFTGKLQSMALQSMELSNTLTKAVIEKIVKKGLED